MIGTLIRRTGRRAAWATSLTIAAVLGTVLLPGPAFADPPYCQTHTCSYPSAYPIKGVDTSHWQHGTGSGKSGPAIAWTSVRGAGFSFAYMKATQGTGLVDPWFTTDYHAALSAHLDVSPYHYWDQSTGSGAAQASHFIAELQAVGYNGAGAGQLPPMLDLESCPTQTTLSNVKAFLNAVQNAFGVAPYVYTSVGDFVSCLPSGANLSGYDLFVARYGVSSPGTLPAGGWSSWTFWQFTDYASIPGIPLRADEDVFVNTQLDLDCAANKTC